MQNALSHGRRVPQDLLRPRLGESFQMMFNGDGFDEEIPLQGQATAAS
jgi:hypothetical protein